MSNSDTRYVIIHKQEMNQVQNIASLVTSEPKTAT